MSRMAPPPIKCARSSCPVDKQRLRAECGQLQPVVPAIGAEIPSDQERNERDLNPRGVNPSAFKADAFGRSAIVPSDTLSRIRSHVRRFLAGDVESVSTISDLGLR